LLDVSIITEADRTQPGLPLKKGRCGTMTHERNTTAMLFVALNAAGDTVIGMCDDCHCHQMVRFGGHEFLDNQVFLVDLRHGL
jgi:hypothetical protein